jgi:hypothetical protein
MLRAWSSSVSENDQVAANSIPDSWLDVEPSLRPVQASIIAVFPAPVEPVAMMRSALLLA